MANENIIDSLSIQIQSDAKDANQVLDGLSKRLEKLSGVLKDLSGKKVNIGVTADTVEVLRKFANAIEEINIGKLQGFANLTQQIKKIELGLKADDGNNLSMFAMALDDLDLNKFSAFAEASKNVHSLSMGIGGPTADAFAKFIDALNRADVAKLTAFTDAFRGFGGINIGFGDTGAKAFGDVATAINAMDVGKILTLTNSFRDFGGINIGVTTKSVEALFSFVDAVNKLNVEKLREMSTLDFTNFLQLAGVAPDLRGLATILYALQKMADRASQAEEKLATASRSVTKETKTTTRAVSKHTGALANLWNSIKRIAFYRLIRSAIKAFTQGFSEGIENLYYWSQEVGTSFAPAMDRLATATLYLKNGFASMWSPLIERAIPVIDTVIDRLVDMFNVVQEMFAQMTGQATWNKALKYPTTYKEELDDAAGSAKALQNILMDFDEINAINTPKSGSRGKAGDEKDYSAMFELMETSTNSPLGKFGEIFSDIGDKISTAYDTVKKFVDYFFGLNFQPITDSTSALWDVVSPILDELNDDAKWLEEKVFEPIAKFLVEKGIPATIDTLASAIGSLWDAFKPLKEGLKKFWDENGDWIMKVVGDAFLNALDTIKKGFEKIGEFFKKNKSVENIVKNISTIMSKFGESKFLEWLMDFLNTAAFDSFMTSITTTLEALEPVLKILDGIFDIIGSIFVTQYKGEHQAVDGLKKLASGLFDLIVSPLKLILLLFADLVDLVSTFAGPQKQKEMQEFASKVRTAADNMEIFKEETYLTADAIEDLSPQPIENVDDASKYAIQTLGQMSGAAKTAFTQTKDWADYCKKWGLDPVTGAILDIERGVNGLPKSSEESAKGIYAAYKSGLGWSAGYDIGYTFGASIREGIQNKVGVINIPAEVQVRAIRNQVAMDKKMENLLYLDTKNIFAGGGFPDQGSLFLAGEIPGQAEMLGSIGGRTAVAGGAEITGIREAVELSGQRQENLLRTLINAVNSKDLTLVANSATGRWVNKALKSYAGVTG